MKNNVSIKKIYSKEYLILICIGFLPLIWKVLEIILLISFDNALKILGQISLISIIFKIFEETLINPLYKTFNKSNYASEEAKNTVTRMFLKYYLLATFAFTVLIFIFIDPIMKISMIPNYIFNETISFLKIYVIASGLGIISKYLFTSSIINKDTKKMLIYLLIKSLITAGLFILLVPTYSFSLGINGIAITELIVNFTTIAYFILTLPKLQKSNISFDKKQYLKLSFYSFSETLIRNVVYYFIILVFLNMLDNQDLYFVANEYLWSIMLVPALAQSTLIKQDISNNKDFSLKPYFINSLILISFMVILIPISLLTFKYIYNLDNYLSYFITLLKLFPCYIIFVIDSIIEAYFLATGKLHHILIQNLLTNILVYLTAFILYLCNIWTITLNSIIFLFNLGVIVSSIYTISIYFFTKRKISTI